jgi:hypothetical protein
MQFIRAWLLLNTSSNAGRQNYSFDRGTKAFRMWRDSTILNGKNPRQLSANLHDFENAHQELNKLIPARPINSAGTKCTTSIKLPNSHPAEWIQLDATIA